MQSGYFWILLIIINLFAILLFLKIGFAYEKWEWKRSNGKKKLSSQMAEGAIFALLGLLVAFTFSSAAQKFDHRRQLIIQESNAIGTAYLRLSLLSNPDRHDLKKEFSNYLNMRQEFYKNIQNEKAANQILLQLQAQQKKIWEKAINACQHQQDPSTSCKLILSSLNNMFDMGSERVYNLLLHPPLIIFGLLFGIVLLTALLNGYSISQKRLKNSFHVICYTIVIVIVTYIIIDLEYPRIGFIRISKMDRAFFDVKKSIEEDQEVDY